MRRPAVSGPGATPDAGRGETGRPATHAVGKKATFLRALFARATDVVASSAVRFLIVLLLAASLAAPAGAAGSRAPAAKQTQPALPDSRQMERDLQSLSWPQFTEVVKAIPKLKADIDAYGPIGWKYVETRYASHPWHKNIDKLDPTQRRQLAELIRRAQRPAASLQ